LAPHARTDGLVVQELPEETVVYDLQRHNAHCLNPTAALVWKHCDGKTSVKEIAALLPRELDLPPDEEIVRLAVERLERAHLLQEPALEPESVRVSRRELARRVGLVGGLAAMLPVVTSIVAPTPALAVGSPPPITGQGGGCSTQGLPCTGFARGTCGSGCVCRNGRCVSA
jgi:hypothetical protein